MNFSHYSGVSLKIKRSGGKPFSLYMERYQTVLALKEEIYKKTGLFPYQQKLIFHGNQLVDDFSIGYYRINESDSIFLLPVKREFSYRYSSYTLLKQLLNILEIIPTASPSEYRVLINQIHVLIQDPVLVSSARINRNIQSILDYAKDFAQASENWMYSDDQSHKFIAQKADLRMSHLEGLSDGVRAMYSIFEDQKNDSSSLTPISTSMSSSCESSSESSCTNSCIPSSVVSEAPSECSSAYASRVNSSRSKRYASLRNTYHSPLTIQQSSNNEYEQQNRNISTQTQTQSNTRSRINQCNSCITNKTNLDYFSKISESPLPTLWRRKNATLPYGFQNHTSIFQNAATASIGSKRALAIRNKSLQKSENVRSAEYLYTDTLREKFSNQIAALKKLGYADDNTVLEVLAETDGNIQKTIRILKNRFGVYYK